MYIKSITIEGFKSYGNRTVINGFDPSFNAITGLNGSGKSNILDSICFVLGITNLSQVNVIQTSRHISCLIFKKDDCMMRCLKFYILPFFFVTGESNKFE